jgi:enoyl-CoA hydratase/carnithine racemase
VHRAGEDDDGRVLIVTGVPGAFCAGTDLADLATIPGAERGLRGTAEERGRWWPIVECPKPVIGAVDGPAVGMGAEFTSQCDVRIATPNARFAWNFAHRGLVPDTGAGSWLLPRLIGPARALRLLCTGEFVTAEEALTIGYVDRIVESGRLMEEARALARAMQRGSPFAHRRVKALMYEGLGSDVASLLERRDADSPGADRRIGHRSYRGPHEAQHRGRLRVRRSASSLDGREYPRTYSPASGRG